MFPAFKEWQSVCDALGNAQQSILIRKGGINEGIAGFAFQHAEFLLFPTRYHNQPENIRIPTQGISGEWKIGDLVPIQYAARLISCAPLNFIEQLQALEPLHIWSKDWLAKRFDYSQPGLPAGAIQAALVRVYRLPEIISIPYEESFAGCKSWIELPVEEKLLTAAQPVMDDDAFELIQNQWAKLIAPPEPSLQA